MDHTHAPLAAHLAAGALLVLLAGCDEEPAAPPPVDVEDVGDIEIAPPGEIDVSRPASIALPRAETPPKILIIGMDGADLRNIEALRAKGKLPNFSRLMETGLTAKLATVANASPIVWTTIATGALPPKHGIEFFRDENNRPAASTMRKRPAFWNILSHHDHSVGILGWWATFPAETVLGYVVSPYLLLMPPIGTRTRVGAVGDTKDLRKSYPLELAAELSHLMYHDKDLALQPIRHLYADPKRTTNTRWVLAKDWSYYAMAMRQMREQPVDVVAVYFQGIDAGSHDWDRWVIGINKDEVREPKVSPDEVAAANARLEAMYAYNDELLGGLIGHAGEDTDIIVLSDHGWNYDGTSHWDLLPGIFLAKGPSFRKGMFEGAFSVEDVTPILLAILGVPLSPELDGKVPDGVLRGDIVAGIQHATADYPIDPVAAAPDGADVTELDQAMIERLQELGYIDAAGNATQGAKKHEKSK